MEWEVYGEGGSLDMDRQEMEAGTTEAGTSEFHQEIGEIATQRVGYLTTTSVALIEIRLLDKEYAGIGRGRNRIMINIGGTDGGPSKRMNLVAFSTALQTR